MAYNDERLDRCLEHVNFPRDRHPSVPLALLQKIQAHQVSTVPFESIALHYSEHRQLSLKLDNLFQKIVVDGKGGYCMELNAFFGAVLRGLGFTVTSAGGRVKIGERYTGWSHMVNIVTIDGVRYLVDVGYGSNGPMQPVPLESGHEFPNILPRRGKLEYRSLAQHTDPHQRIWVFSTRDNEKADWQEQYSFTEMEFFPEDFEVMNLSTMTVPDSFFVQTVLAMRVVMDESSGELVGNIVLFKNEVKRTHKGETEVLETLGNEEQRVKALAKYFGIKLSPREIAGIKGNTSELKG